MNHRVLIFIVLLAGLLLAAVVLRLSSSSIIATTTTTTTTTTSSTSSGISDATWLQTDAADKRETERIDSPSLLLEERERERQKERDEEEGLTTTPKKKTKTVAELRPTLVAELNGKGKHSYCCCADIELLFPYLARFFFETGGGYFIDVGCNYGSTTAGIMEAFFNLEYTRFVSKFTNRGIMCGPTKDDLSHTVLAFEPNPATLVKLKGRRERSLWNLTDFRIIEKAASDHMGTANFQVSTPDHPGTASLTRSGGITVPLTTVDEELKVQLPKMTDKHCFLLKTDTEGHDPVVLRGATDLLTNNPPSFLTFEYHSLWFTTGHHHTLQSTSEWLRTLGYCCFWISEANLLPLTGKWWIPEYECRRWSNVFCGRADDPNLARLFRFYNTDSWTEDVLDNGIC